MDQAFFAVRTPHPRTHQQHLYCMYEPPGMHEPARMHACCCTSCCAHELMQHAPAAAAAAYMRASVAACVIDTVYQMIYSSAQT
jgi:hypothetical protein